MMNDLKKELDNRKQCTENGAIGYVTTGKDLLDLNFKASSLRNMSDKEVANLFFKAFYENKLLAIKWLFFLRDREGMGERKSFRTIIYALNKEHPEIVKELISLIPEYGRWDDLYCLMDGELKNDVVDFIRNQLEVDLLNFIKDEPISLLAKWLPKESTKTYKKLYKVLLKELKMSPSSYRKLTSTLRKYLNVLEVKMSANEWDKIDYNAVPSKANLLYRNAFIKHDQVRRLEYLNSLKNGDDNVKINAKVLMPHEIVHKYFCNRCSYYDANLQRYYDAILQHDESLEQLWKALPDYVNGEGFSMFVRDGSGSMYCGIGNSNATCLDVSTALAIYFAEKCEGEYKNKFITFSSHPKIIDLSNCNSLQEKLNRCYREDDCSSTDIYKVFKLVLKTAVDNKYSQEQLPKNIIIASDMEFNYGCEFDETLFEKIKNEYEFHGYKLPRLVFWNICSRTNTIPLKENDNGIALVSGFSTSIMDMVLSGELDPYKCLVNKLNTDRYKPVEEAVKNALK